jgi:DNA helicase-2/ATP-dependent DNA helicase PcrA
MFTPTAEQRAIIKHFDGHGLVIAGPGSGKTSTLVEHTVWLIEKRGIPKDDIWVMVFNRDIATKLKDKIEAKIGDRAPKVTTVHAFILQQTLKHGAELLGEFEIGDNLRATGLHELIFKPIAKRLRDKHGIRQTPEGKDLTVSYVEVHLWNAMRDFWLTTEEPADQLFAKFRFELGRLKKLLGVIFFDELALKFRDEMTANPSFRDNVVKKRVIIDEFQDLNPTEHDVLRAFHDAGVSFLVFGDDDQAVNDFRRAHADLVRSFKDIYVPIEHPLSRDKRCPKEILELADSFVSVLPGRLSKAPGGANHKGRIDILSFTDDDEEKSKIAEIIRKYMEKDKAGDNGSRPQILVLTGGTGKVRNESRVGEITNSLIASGLEDVTSGDIEDPLDSPYGLALKGIATFLHNPNSGLGLYTWLAINKKALLRRILEHIENSEGRGVSPTFLDAVGNLRASARELADVLLIINGLRARINDPLLKIEEILNIVPDNLAGKNEALTVVHEFCRQIPEEENNEMGISQRFIKDFNIWVSDYVRRKTIGKIHVTTYRKAKGLEADLVIVTAVDNSEFPDTPLKRRLLYVSTTRTRKNLVLTFASSRSGARRYIRGRNSRYRGNPRSYRTSLIPGKYRTQPFTQEWLDRWGPV